MTRIAIILGSTRPGRNGEAVANWVHDIARQRTDAEYELVDIADFKLPHLDEVAPPSLGRYTQPHTKAWAEKIASFDGRSSPGAVPSPRCAPPPDDTALHHEYAPRRQGRRHGRRRRHRPDHRDPCRRCASSTERSPNTGAWPTFSPSWSSWAPAPAPRDPAGPPTGGGARHRPRHRPRGRPGQCSSTPAEELP